MTVRELFEFVTDPSITADNIDAYLAQVSNACLSPCFCSGAGVLHTACPQATLFMGSFMAGVNALHRGDTAQGWSNGPLLAMFVSRMHPCALTPAWQAVTFGGILPSLHSLFCLEPPLVFRYFFQLCVFCLEDCVVLGRELGVFCVERVPPP